MNLHTNIEYNIVSAMELLWNRVTPDKRVRRCRGAVVSRGKRMILTMTSADEKHISIHLTSKPQFEIIYRCQGKV